jgi:spermidine dehydrogenase
MSMSNDDDRRADRDLGMHRPITRRDFLNGVALGIGSTMSAAIVRDIPGGELLLEAAGLTQEAAGYYPPALTGMRGSHDGSFDASHALRDGRFWQRAGSRSRRRSDTTW